MVFVYVAMYQHQQREYFEISSFHPTRYDGELYGQAVRFSNVKQHISFHSEYTPTVYLQYNKVTTVRVIYDPMRWLLVLGCLTILLVAGIFILFVYMQIPRWKVIIEVKNGDPVKIRARISEDWARQFQDYINGLLPVSVENLKTTPSA